MRQLQRQGVHIFGDSAFTTAGQVSGEDAQPWVLLGFSSSTSALLGVGAVRDKEVVKFWWFVYGRYPRTDACQLNLSAPEAVVLTSIRASSMLRRVQVRVPGGAAIYFARLRLDWT